MVHAWDQHEGPAELQVDWSMQPSASQCKDHSVHQHVQPSNKHSCTKLMDVKISIINNIYRRALSTINEIFNVDYEGVLKDIITWNVLTIAYTTERLNKYWEIAN